MVRLEVVLAPTMTLVTWMVMAAVVIATLWVLDVMVRNVKRAVEFEVDGPIVKPFKSVVDSKGRKCPICLDVISDMAIVLPCRHKFDLFCIDNWYQATNSTIKSCPVCREPIVSVIHSIEFEEDILPMSNQVRQRIIRTRISGN